MTKADPAQSPADLADAITELAGYAQQFAAIDRTACYWPDQQTKESDTDHTVMLAWVAPALASLLYPDLDTGLIAEFAAVHDAVEVFAGDTPTLRISATERIAKTRREAAAASRWRDLFAQRLPWIADRIYRYETQAEPEARFVRAVDKMMPRLVHAGDRCIGLREMRMGLAELAATIPDTNDRITGHGEFPGLEPLAVELGERLLAIHAAALESAPCCPEP